ncbi:MAG: hypothetical protein ACD_63C00023G0008 [uncultured bacterium]|nr:MAG: hypothetical protein ACD_63C00023G0008 [uncultured bacterium]
MIAHAKDLIKDAFKRGYALGSFNTFNLESTQGIVNAANMKSAPIIIQISETTVDYAGIKPITHIVSTIAKNEAVLIPIALHLDHGKKFHSIIETINAGFTSVQIDGSDLVLDENIMLTKQIVEYAHRRNVIVQGEVGRIPGTHESADKLFVEKGMLTDPDEAEKFVRETGVDTLAVSIGNCHGIKPTKLDFDLLKKIRDKVDVPLILHGGSRVTTEDVKFLVKTGITEINIDTEIRESFTLALRNTLASYPDEIDPRKILAPSKMAVAKAVEEKLDTFGCVGKAV